MIKYLDLNGLIEVLRIIKAKDSKIESDVSAVLSAMLAQLSNKADKSDLESTWSGTKEEYDAIETKDENTIYYITQ